MRLQCMNPTEFAMVVSESQLGKQLGNAMSVNVLERIFARALPAAGLVKPGVLIDTWQTGEAIEQLSSTRDKGFKVIDTDGHDSTECYSLTTYTAQAVGGGYERRPNEYQRWNRSDGEGPLQESPTNFKKKETLFVISGSSDEEETDCDQSYGHVNMVGVFVADVSDSGDS